LQLINRVTTLGVPLEHDIYMFLRRDIRARRVDSSWKQKQLMHSISQRGSVSRIALSLLLRAGRISKYSPSWRGVNTLTKWYRRVIPPDLLLRVKDIDKDLIFDVNVRGNMGLYLWHYPDLFEKEERELFCSFITPSCTVLDVGANIGFYTLLAAKRGARVFSIEADPVNAAMLRHHVEINGFNDRVTIYEMAATDATRAVALYRHPFNLGESNIVAQGQQSGMIEGRTLDSLNLPPVDICKMDIEGAELMALRGMEETMDRSPQIKLLVEYAQHLSTGQGLLSYLRTNFSSVEVIEKSEAAARGEIPEFCNLLAVRSTRGPH
jgi:FkbM family methyltransferase